MKPRFGNLDLAVDTDEVQNKAQVLGDRLEILIDQFIEEVGESLNEPSDETLTAIGLAIDFINSNHWGGITQWYGFPPEVGDEVFEHLLTAVYRGSTGVLKRVTSKYLRDSN